MIGGGSVLVKVRRMRKDLKKKLKGGAFTGVTKVRSQAMSKIRGKGNKSTEARFRGALIRHRVRGWKLHPKAIGGHPDIYFPDHKLVIFLDGCFWHGCPRCGHIPKTRTGFWREKIRLNKQRDARVSKDLKKDGYVILRLWEHEINENLRGCIEKVKRLLSDCL